MKKLIFSLLFIPVMSMASGGSIKLDHVKIDVGDVAALQRGAKVFVNYCMGCHSTKFVSYGRLAKDLSLTEDQVYKHMVGTYGKKKRLSDYMITAMSKEQAERFFGKAPPDLSTIFRARGKDWLYTYLRSFYSASYIIDAKDSKKEKLEPCQKKGQTDDKYKKLQVSFKDGKNSLVACRDNTLPFGVNNTVFEKVSMPHVMLSVEGEKVAIFQEYFDESDVEKKISKKYFVKFVALNAEGLGQKELAAKAKKFDGMIRDAVTYKAWVGDPGKLFREKVGFWVLLFLVVFTILAYFMKKEFWKDIH